MRKRCPATASIPTAAGTAATAAPAATSRQALRSAVLCHPLPAPCPLAFWWIETTLAGHAPHTLRLWMIGRHIVRAAPGPEVLPHARMPRRICLTPPAPPVLWAPWQDSVNTWLADACQAGARIITGGCAAHCISPVCVPASLPCALSAIRRCPGEPCQHVQPTFRVLLLLRTTPYFNWQQSLAGAWVERILVEPNNEAPPAGGHPRRKQAAGVLVLAGSEASPLRLAVQARGRARFAGSGVGSIMLGGLQVSR